MSRDEAPAVPLQSSSTSTADGLLSSLNGQLESSAVSAPATYTNRRFRVYVSPYTASQSLSPSQGVFVLSSKARTWTPPGTAYTSGQTDIFPDSRTKPRTARRPTELRRCASLCGKFSSTRKRQPLFAVSARGDGGTQPSSATRDAAYPSAARTWASVSRYASITDSTVSPPANCPTTRRTGIRVPLITGIPCTTAGSIVIPGDTSRH